LIFSTRNDIEENSKFPSLLIESEAEKEYNENIVRKNIILRFLVKKDGMRVWRADFRKQER